MRSLSRLLTGLAISLAIPPEASAQSTTVVLSSIGVLYRYAGDTIWHERDTTVRRTVYRGDTVDQTTFVGAKLRNSRTMVVIGDSAVTISTTDSLGSRTTRSAMPTRLALLDRDALARAIQSNAMRAQLATSGVPFTSASDVPVAPRDPILYCVDGSLSIRQHVDTVQYIRAMPGKAFDTTTYVFTGDTTVRRLSPSPREFGHAMTNTVVGEMHMSLVRKSIEAREAPLTVGLPGRSTMSRACAGR